MCLEVIIMVGPQKILDLLGEEGEELFRSLSYHELPRYCHLGLRKGEGSVAVQLDRTDTEIGAAEIYR